MHKNVLSSFIFSKFGLVVITFGFLSACGGSGANSTDTTATAAPATAATAANVRTSPGPVGQFGGVNLPNGHQLVALQQSCQICHSLDMVYTQRLSKATWTAEVTKMMKFGAPLHKSDKAAVVAYLTKYLGPAVPRSKDRATALAPAMTYSAAAAQQ